MDAIHLDVMDGVFVPNLTFGPLVIEAVRRVTNLPLDVHLMIEHPAGYLSDYVDAGADWISIHIEACPHIHRDLTKIKDLGKRAGIAINPGTPVASLDSVMDEADFILVMSVNPGFGGQKFVSSTLDKLNSIRLIREQRGVSLEIAVDGGNRRNIRAPSYRGRRNVASHRLRTVSGPGGALPRACDGPGQCTSRRCRLRGRN